jgi:hypothetical protein
VIAEWLNYALIDQAAMSRRMAGGGDYAQLQPGGCVTGEFATGALLSTAVFVSGSPHPGMW